GPEGFRGAVRPIAHCEEEWRGDPVQVQRPGEGRDLTLEETVALENARFPHGVRQHGPVAVAIETLAVREVPGERAEGPRTRIGKGVPASRIAPARAGTRAEELRA